MSDPVEDFDPPIYWDEGVPCVDVLLPFALVITFEQIDYAIHPYTDVYLWEPDGRVFASTFAVPVTRMC